MDANLAADLSVPAGLRGGYCCDCLAVWPWGCSGLVRLGNHHGIADLFDGLMKPGGMGITV